MLHTLLYAGLLSLLYMWLSYVVTTHRHRTHTGLGVGEDDGLQRAVRIHGNFAEYVPFILLLLALAEFNGAPVWCIHLAGGLLFVARLLHISGLKKSAHKSRARWWGTALTFSQLFFLGLLNVALFVMGLLSKTT